MIPTPVSMALVPAGGVAVILEDAGRARALAARDTSHEVVGHDAGPCPWCCRGMGSTPGRGRIGSCRPCQGTGRIQRTSDGRLCFTVEVLLVDPEDRQRCPRLHPLTVTVTRAPARPTPEGRGLERRR